jgi:diamine N-acetyltransferase
MMLSNGNITLRALEPNDIELVYQWENDVHTWRAGNQHAPVSKFMLANYIKSSNADIWESKQMRLIVQNVEGKPVGTVELFEFDPYHSRAGVGVMVFAESERRKGIAFETLQLINDYARDHIGLNQLYANIAASNKPSIELFKKLGYVVAGEKKRWLRTPSGWENEWLMQLFLSE